MEWKWRYLTRQVRVKDERGRRYTLTLDDDTTPIEEALEHLAEGYAKRSPTMAGKLAGCSDPPASCRVLGIACPVSYPGKVEYQCTMPPTTRERVPRGVAAVKVEEEIVTCSCLIPYWKVAARQGKQKTPKRDGKPLPLTLWGDRPAILKYLREKCESLVALAARSRCLPDPNRFLEWQQLGRAAAAVLNAGECRKEDADALSRWLLYRIRQEQPWRD